MSLIKMCDICGDIESSSNVYRVADNLQDKIAWFSEISDAVEHICDDCIKAYNESGDIKLYYDESENEVKAK